MSKDKELLEHIVSLATEIKKEERDPDKGLEEYLYSDQVRKNIGDRIRLFDDSSEKEFCDKLIQLRADSSHLVLITINNMKFEEKEAPEGEVENKQGMQNNLFAKFVEARNINELKYISFNFDLMENPKAGHDTRLPYGIMENLVECFKDHVTKDISSNLEFIDTKGKNHKIGCFVIEHMRSNHLQTSSVVMAFHNEGDRTKLLENVSKTLDQKHQSNLEKTVAQDDIQEEEQSLLGAQSSSSSSNIHSRRINKERENNKSIGESSSLLSAKKTETWAEFAKRVFCCSGRTHEC